MQLSHSKLNTILTCPMTYYLKYEQKISLKVEKTALEIGSAVHWGIEHETEDLTEFISEIGNYRLNQYDYGKEQVMAEGMVHGYLARKNEIFDQILTDYDGSKLQLIDETHELNLNVPLKSYKYDEPHMFNGIIDLLLLTNKGFIIVDYKTSSGVPEWEKYLDQLYRYRYIINQAFPEYPVYKIAIVNLRKSGIRLKKDESPENYLLRLKNEYVASDDMIVYHEFEPSLFNGKGYDDYIDNLIKECDFAQDIVDNRRFFINYGQATGMYGKSEYWDIFYNTPDYQLLYKVKDRIWNEDWNEFTDYRDARKIDFTTLTSTQPVLNHYDVFIDAYNRLYGECSSDEEFKARLKDIYATDDGLIDIYLLTRKKEKEADELPAVD